MLDAKCMTITLDLANTLTDTLLIDHDICPVSSPFIYAGVSEDITAIHEANGHHFEFANCTFLKCLFSN